MFPKGTQYIIYNVIYIKYPASEDLDHLNRQRQNKANSNS